MSCRRQRGAAPIEGDPESAIDLRSRTRAEQFRAAVAVGGRDQAATASADLSFCSPSLEREVRSMRGL